MKLYGLEQQDLFSSFEDRLTKAYDKQANIIAYAGEIVAEQ